MAIDIALRAAVDESLAAYATTNAVFLAERLLASSPTPESKYLLATAYHAAGQTHRAYAVLSPATTPKNRYLLAVCAFKLGKLQEAENALLAGASGVEGAPSEAYCALLLGQICRAGNRNQKATEHFLRALELQPALWTAYENLCQLGADEDAARFFREDTLLAATPQPQQQHLLHPQHNNPASSSHLNVLHMQQLPTPTQGRDSRERSAPPGEYSGIATPGLLASSLSGLGGLGGPVTPSSAGGSGGGHAGLQTPAWSVAHATPGSAVHGVGGGQGVLLSTPSLNTPVGVGGQGGAMPMQVEGTPVDLSSPPSNSGPPPVRKDGAGQRRLRSSGERESGRGVRGSAAPIRILDGENTDPSMLAPSSRTPSSSSTATTIPATRRSARLSFQGAGSGSGGGYGADGLEEEAQRLKKQHMASLSSLSSSSSSSASIPRALKPSLQSAAHPPARPPESPQAGANQSGLMAAGAAELCALLRQLATAYQHLSLYRAEEAVRAFKELPRAQLNTGWVQAQIATAHFNLAQHHKAEQAFRRARQLEPHRLQGMEVYSTVLWFLKREHELCYLAQEVVALDRLAPQTWCVLGNCFSLQREFETAIKFFNRAVQVDPSFTYAYTLAGHEHVSNEDFDKATASFRNALRYDDRHYNAWYGLGTIYLKQEKYQLAEYHFRRGLSINPRNSVLQCYLGMALLSSGACDDAIHELQRAIDMDPSNPLARLRKAMALSQLQRNEEALGELLSLQQLAPRESTVFVQMGKVQKKLGRQHDALASFNHALDLDPKSGNVIKAHIDKLQMADIAEDDSMV